MATLKTVLHTKLGKKGNMDYRLALSLPLFENEVIII